MQSKLNFTLAFVAVFIWFVACALLGWGASAIIDAAYVATSPHSPNSQHCNDKPVDGLLEAYPYGCYGAARYDALRTAAPPCIPDVNRQYKGDAR